MSAITRTVFGIQVQINSDLKTGSPELDQLNKDLSRFERIKMPKVTGKIKVSISKTLSSIPFTKGAKVFGGKMYEAYGVGEERYINYRNELELYSKGSRDREVWICHNGGPILYEVLHTLIHSFIGECLDRSGYHRVHALALGVNDRNILVVLPSGGGKSSLAYQIAKNGVGEVYSDESPFLKEGLLYSYPSRGALSEKVTSLLKIDKPDISYKFKRQLYGEKYLIDQPMTSTENGKKLTDVIVGRSTSKVSKISKSSATSTLNSLISTMVIGNGLTQMAEHLLKVDNVILLTKVSISRLAEAYRVSQSVTSHTFEYTENTLDNFEVLRQFLTDFD